MLSEYMKKGCGRNYEKNIVACNEGLDYVSEAIYNQR